MDGEQETRLLRLNACPERLEAAAAWFSAKWGIPMSAYLDSMTASLRQPDGIPRWYLVLNPKQEIIAGAGMIDNDFHDRKDLTPNLCALYVQAAYRNRGLARQLLDTARHEAGALGFSTLYLITDHTAFYEKCGWTFLTMVTGDDQAPARMYAAPTDFGSLA